MKHFLKPKLTIISASIAVMFSLPAYSQSQSEENTVEEVLVIGTKIEQSLQDLEVSAEVFDLERLEQEQVNELSDLLLKVPNVNTTGGADANFTIRGIGRAGVGGAGQGVTSNVYVDGAPISGINLNRGTSSLWDVEQVEVLRGPQSSVQGRNALAGAIIVKTADPTFEPEGKFKATISEGDTYQVAGAYGGAIINDLLAGRIAVDFQGTDGFSTGGLEETLGDDFNASESVTVRGKLLLAPASIPWFTSKLTVDYNESEITGSDSLTVEAPDNSFDFDPTDLITFDEPQTNDNEGLRVVNETAFDLNDQLTLRSIITYEDYSSDRTFGDLDDLTIFSENLFNQFDETIYSGELRLEFDYESIKGLVGLYYYDSERVNDRDQLLDVFTQVVNELENRNNAFLDNFVVPFTSVSPEGSVAQLLSGETIETENYAIFGQVDWQFAPKWTLGFGARYDNEKFEENGSFQGATTSAGCTIITPFPGIFSASTVTPCQDVANGLTTGVNPAVSADFDAFLPRASLTYDINDNSSVFISASRGYRAGGAFVAEEEDEDAFFNPTFVGTFEPEFLTTFEIGTRNILLDGKLTLNANIFFSDYEDQQVSVDQFIPSDGRDDTIENVGESSIYGLELLADYQINDNTNVFLTLGLLNAEFDDFSFSEDADGNPNNPDDPQFANLAGDSFQGAADYSFTIGVNWRGDNGFFASSSFTVIGESEGDIPNLDNANIRDAFINDQLDPNLAGNEEETRDKITNLTARFGWGNDHMTVYVFGTNLLDDDGITSRNIATVDNQTGQAVLSDAFRFTLQQPRSVGAGVEFKF